MADDKNPTKAQPRPGNPLNRKTPETFDMDADRGDKSELESKSPRTRTGKFDDSNRAPYMKTTVSGAYPQGQLSKARSHADAIAKKHDKDDMDI